jgi:hypothetical protein
LAAAIAPLIGAALASASYNLLFASAAAIALLSLALFRFTVREPRWEPKPPITTLPPATGE